MKQLFGTDGIRGKANQYPMTPELALKLGKAVAIRFATGESRPRIVIGKDTRLSGYMLETALTSGLVAMGADVLLVGPMPTPAISHLTRSLNADAGIMISASHNHAEDNGIKIFDSKGYKLFDEDEEEIEKIIFSEKMESGRLNGKHIGKAFRINDAQGRYIEFAKASIGNISLRGIKAVVDCANGAAYRVAPQIFSELGVEIMPINHEPDGLNINLNCGATDVRHLKKKVLDSKADLGVALDGDADRVIIIDSRGNEINGDRILAALALDMQDNNELAQSTVVATVMSNAGFEKHLKNNKLKIVRTSVGDRYVIEEMRKNAFTLGGEQSGHIIFGKYSTTGDGIIAALQIMRLMKQLGRPVSGLCNSFELFPQVLVNVKVKEKKPLNEIASVQKLIDSYSKKFGDNGRILVRYSGTENICRVMIEGTDENEIKLAAEQIAEKIRGVIGIE
ncbi:MAG: phosphoglucosamine mutase [archaeon]